MILLAVQDRRVEVETGYGVEGILPDGRVGAIIRSRMVPYFRDQRWSPGLLAGVQELARILHAEYQPAAAPAAPGPGLSLGAVLGWVYFLGWLGFLLWHNLRRHTLSYAVLALSALPGLLWLLWAFMPFVLPFILGVILAGANVRARCPRCGRWLVRQQRTVRAASYAAPGQREIIYDCASCGYHDVDIVSLPRRVRTATVPVGGTAWPGGWSGGGGSFGTAPRAGGSFKRFGGGSSGGGGAGASF
jgi:uncharacterized protein